MTEIGRAYLAVMDQLRDEIAQRQAALDALEKLAGIHTLPALPAQKSEATAKPAPLPPAGEPRRAALLTGKPKRNQHSGKVDPDRMRAMHAEGKNDIQIGAELGVSSSAITLWRKKLGLAPNGRGGKRKPTPASFLDVVTVNSAALIVSWLRQRDTVIAELDPGKTWKVNGRDVIDRGGLLTMANRKRDLMKLPPFKWEND